MSIQTRVSHLSAHAPSKPFVYDILLHVGTIALFAELETALRAGRLETS